MAQVTDPAYKARTAYQQQQAAQEYEAIRFSNWLGRVRWRAERTAVRAVLDTLPTAECILDCPCGIGRWAAILAESARRIVGLDISAAMLERTRRERVGCFPLSLVGAEAERLPLADGCVDYVFCYALMKHLPPEVKRTVLREFARVARRGIVVSFAVFNPLTYLRWRWMRWRLQRRIQGTVHSYPVWPKELQGMTREFDLQVQHKIGVMGWLSLEKVLYLEKTTRLGENLMFER